MLRGEAGTIAALCRGGARRAPERNAIEWDGGSLTFAALDQRTDALARHFQQRLEARSGRIGIYCANRVEWIEAYVAAHKAGIPAVPINHYYRDRELRHILNDARISFVVYDGTAGENEDVRELLASRGILEVGDAYERAARAPGPVPVAWTGNEDAVVYTSGTTANPKGVVYTSATQVTSVFMPQMAMGYAPSDRFLLFTPLAHRAAQPLLLCALILGATTFLLERYTPKALAATVRDREITALTGVPTAMKDLLGLRHAERAAPMPGVRHVLMSGESMPGDLLREIMALFPRARFGSAYGSSEAGLITFLDHEHQLAHPRSCGRALQGVEVRLEDDAGRAVGCEEPGEVLVRAGAPGTYTVAAGYLGPGGIEPFVDGDGWFHTGDIATVDAGGFYRIIDRKKDMILSGGMNIASKEVEEVIAAHPAVSEVAVTGEPDERFGERVVAWIVARDGLPRPDEAEIVAHVVAHAAPYKKPRSVRFVDALPRSAAGKVLKRALPVPSRATADPLQSSSTSR